MASCPFPQSTTLCHSRELLGWGGGVLVVPGPSAGGLRGSEGMGMGVLGGVRRILNPSPPRLLSRSQTPGI